MSGQSFLYAPSFLVAILSSTGNHASTRAVMARNCMLPCCIRFVDALGILGGCIMPFEWSVCMIACEKSLFMQDRVVLSRDAHGVCMCCSVICAHGYVGFVPEPQLYVD